MCETATAMSQTWMQKSQVQAFCLCKAFQSYVDLPSIRASDLVCSNPLVTG